jgi:hypothetical protein
MLLRIVSGVMALVFLLCVVVQYNDPDGMVWMAIYGAAGVLSALAALRPGRPDWRVAAAVGGIAAAWGLALFAGVGGRVSWPEIFGDYEMKTAAIEEARESIGLAIVALWCGLLAWMRRPRRAA